MQSQIRYYSSCCHAPVVHENFYQLEFSGDVIDHDFPAEHVFHEIMETEADMLGRQEYPKSPT